VTRSFAHAAARSAGLDEKIIERALEVKFIQQYLTILIILLEEFFKVEDLTGVRKI